MADNQSSEHQGGISEGPTGSATGEEGHASRGIAVSPPLCATNFAAWRWDGGLAFWRNRQARYGNKHDPPSPVHLAGLLFGDPCPLRWLPADARRMPRRDSRGVLRALFWGVGSARAARGEGELRSDEALRLPDRARAVENRPRLRGGWRDWVR